MKTLMSDHKGSILISALLFLGLMTFLVNGVSVMVKNQTTHLAQISHSYVAKTLIQKSAQLTEKAILEDIELNKEVQQQKIQHLMDKKERLEKQVRVIKHVVESKNDDMGDDDLDDRIAKLKEKVEQLLEGDDHNFYPDHLNELDESLESDIDISEESDLLEKLESVKQNLKDIDSELDALQSQEHDQLDYRGTFQYKKGTVQLTTNRDKYTFKAVLDGGYTLEKTIRFNVPVEISEEDEAL